MWIFWFCVVVCFLFFSRVMRVLGFIVSRMVDLVAFRIFIYFVFFIYDFSFIVSFFF